MSSTTAASDLVFNLNILQMGFVYEMRFQGEIRRGKESKRGE